MRPARQIILTAAGIGPAAVRPPASGKPWPWLLSLPALVVGFCILLPLGYLVITAVRGADGEVSEIIFRPKTLQVLLNTFGLCAAVLATTTLLALPAAWLMTCSNLFGRRVWSILLVLPLAVPGYLMAYTLLSVGGSYGVTYRLLEWETPRLTGFTGSLISLTLYNFPYMFLTLRSGFARIDPSLQEAARSLGDGPWRAFFRAELPQLRPAYLAGALLVVLHVLGDFGVVSLMRFDTLSVLLYNSLSFEPTYAAWVAVLMLVVAGLFIGGEVLLLRRRRYDRVTPGAARVQHQVRLRWFAIPVVLLLIVFLFFAIGLPTFSSVYWYFQPTLGFVTRDWGASTAASLKICVPAAIIATGIALTMGLLTQRYAGWRSRGLERLTYAGYATPGLALGLAMVGVALWLDGFIVEAGDTLIYQSLGLIVLAYTLHFLAEAIGPVRTGLMQAGVRVEEAARSLGRGPIAAFFAVTFPLLRNGLAASMALVFLSAIKELPLVMLLRPANYDTLAYNLWDLSNENLYAEAAPFALTILGVSAVFVGVLIWCERQAKSRKMQD
ncbi:ABC transporter permease [Algisphaera agarilytica]|uniref:Iron(III) transport system permease protein n=1 Tax=Algisphaera agarilytica TaxID=1385975 RepID=A0A7X0HC15_9BACT|nr:iron ABC transporter permease [Algisphaera agarilytica]MBB6431605.1 iron(III) transport system permease protein [Algisphaera agarilytica]